MESVYVTRFEIDDATVIRPVGEFDITTVETLRLSLVEALESASKIVVDLSGTVFLDSIALGALVSGGRRARDAGGWLRLVAPQEGVRRALRVTEIDTVFGLYDTNEEAVRHDDGDQGPE